MAGATLLVAGCPVAFVWWLRESGTVTSPSLALLIGMALSLLASGVGRFVWEKQPGSEDLLFNELMVWGYIQRRRKQRRLADAGALIDAGESDQSRRQRRLLERLVAGMETRDPYLHGHSRRVARHSWMIAQRMRLPREEVARIRLAAALHDVGKTKTPKTILHKPGRLTDEEYRIIKLHPGEGGEMVSVLGDLDLVAIVRHHHERIDGSGYPDALTGTQIPLGARIIAVADTFDAITSARPYRPASAHKKAIDILHEESGRRLDADVVKAFCANYAGRGPLALWSFVSGLPERMLAWFSSSVGAIASAAKVAAVAAVVGGAAVTSSMLGLPGAGHAAAKRAHHGGAAASGAVPHRAVTSALPARGAVRAGGSGAAHRTGVAKRHQRRSAGHAAPLAATHVVPVQSAPAGGEHEVSSGHGSGAGVAGEPRSGGEEKSAAKHEERTAPKKEEAKAKHEEGAVKGEEHGKGGEGAGHAKKEEAATTPSEPAPAAGGGEARHGNPSGNSSSSSSSSSSSDTTHGKSSEAAGRTKP